jgi:TonB family protein
MPSSPARGLNYHVAFTMGHRELIWSRGQGRLRLAVTALALLSGGAHAAADSAKPAIPAAEPAKTEAAVVKGELKLELVRNVVKQHIGEVRLCYESQLAKSPGLTGRVTVGFTIGEDGKVTESRVRSSTLGSPSVERCIADAVGGWEFPRPRRGTAAVEYPFVLVAAEPESDKAGALAPRAAGESRAGGRSEPAAEEGAAAQDRPAKEAPPPASGPGSLDMEKELGQMKKGPPGYQDKGVVRSVIRGKLGEIKYCFERGLSKKPGLEGQVMVQFTIGASGEVFEPTVQSSSLNHAETEQCIVNRVKSWRFPPPEGGRFVVTHPFAMRSDSSDG